MSYLLDVSVLIALLDSDHLHYDCAHLWFESRAGGDWATCPITENGALRILSHARYPKDFGNPEAVALVMANLRQMDGHQFWPDDLSLLDTPLVELQELTTSARITDTYLLALAAAKGSKLVTLDQRLSPAAVRGGAAALQILELRCA